MSRTSPLKAKDVMTIEPVSVTPSTRLRELARVFEEHEISGAPVVDGAGHLVGVVSKTDLIRRSSPGSKDVPPAYLFEVLSPPGAHGDGRDVMPEPLMCVGDIMTHDPLTVTPESPLTEVARLMHARRVHRVIVTDSAKLPLGIVTSMDLLGVMARHAIAGPP